MKGKIGKFKTQFYKFRLRVNHRKLYANTFDHLILKQANFL